MSENHDDRTQFLLDQIPFFCPIKCVFIKLQYSGRKFSEKFARSRWSSKQILFDHMCFCSIIWSRIDLINDPGDLTYTNNINKHFRITFYSAQHYPYICIWVVFYEISYCDYFQSLNFVENSWNLIYKSNICFVQDPFVRMAFKSLENYFIECLVCEG